MRKRVSKSGAEIFQLNERRAWRGRWRDGGYRREATWKVETGRRGRLKEKRTVKRKLKERDRRQKTAEVSCMWQRAQILPSWIDLCEKTCRLYVKPILTWSHSLQSQMCNLRLKEVLFANLIYCIHFTKSGNFVQPVKVSDILSNFQIISSLVA